MKTKIKQFLPIILIFIFGCVVGRFSLPAKTITKIETKVVEVIKWKEKIVKVENKDKVTVITEETRPDGTKIVRKEIKDKSTINTNKDKDGSSSKESQSKEEKIVEYSKDLIVSGLVGVNITRPQDGFSYGIGVNRRLIGPVWLGAEFTTSKYFHLGIGLGF